MISEVLSGILVKVLENRGKTRAIFLREFEKKVYNSIVENNPKKRPRKVQEYKYYMLMYNLYIIKKK